MKYLIVLGLLLVVAAYVFWRIRPYLQMARRFVGAIRDMRRINLDGSPVNLSQQGRQTQRQTQRPTQRQAQTTQASNERLVRCTTCGTWTPAAHAVTLRSANSFYCSHDCLERAADATHRTRKSAS